MKIIRTTETHEISCHRCGGTGFVFSRAAVWIVNIFAPGTDPKETNARKRDCPLCGDSGAVTTKIEIRQIIDSL